MPRRNDTELLDEVDEAIVRALQADGRLSVTALAEQVHISRANAYRRLDRIHDLGAIRGYGARVDPKLLGRPIAALIIVNADQGSWRDLRVELLGLPGLEWMAATTGSFDFVVLVRVEDVDTLRDVVLDHLQALPSVRSTETVFILDEEDRRDLA